MEPTTIIVNGRIDQNPWDDTNALQIGEELLR